MYDLKLKDEAALLIKLSEGNELAFTRIFDHYRPRIYSVALKMLKSTHLAEEVVQDVFLTIWKRREYMATIKQFDGYIFMMARNNIYDRFKKLASEEVAQHRYMEENSKTVSNTDHRIIENQYGELLNNTLQMLPSRQRQIYHPSRDKGLRNKQNGKQLNISHLTVKKHMSKALGFIRQRLEYHIEPVIFLLPFLEVFR